MPQTLTRLMVITLQCERCGNTINISKPLSAQVVDFNADRMCCGVWMNHKLKEIRVIEQDDDLMPVLNRM